jgi:hypothetical protein
MPGRLGRLTACCFDEKTEAYLRDPRAHADYVYSEAPLVLAEELVLEEDGQIWVLALSDGHTVFDWSDNRSRDERVSSPLHDQIVADTGELVITVHGQTCRSEMPYHAFVRTCADVLVYHDWGQLAVFSRSPWKLLDVHPVDGTGQRCSTPEQPVARSERIGDATVTWTGMRYTMCVQ